MMNADEIEIAPADEFEAAKLDLAAAEEEAYGPLRRVAEARRRLAEVSKQQAPARKASKSRALVEQTPEWAAFVELLAVELDQLDRLKQAAYLRRPVIDLAELYHLDAQVIVAESLRTLLRGRAPINLADLQIAHNQAGRLLREIDSRMRPACAAVDRAMASQEWETAKLRKASLESLKAIRADTVEAVTAADGLDRLKTLQQRLEKCK